jgi:hypothetical protein
MRRTFNRHREAAFGRPNSLANSGVEEIQARQGELAGDPERYRYPVLDCFRLRCARRRNDGGADLRREEPKMFLIALAVPGLAIAARPS